MNRFGEGDTKPSSGVGGSSAAPAVCAQVGEYVSTADLLFIALLMGPRSHMTAMNLLNGAIHPRKNFFHLRRDDVFIP